MKRTDGSTVRLGFVGCGDVARRCYLRVLAGMADRAAVVACYDADRSRAKRFAADLARTWPSARAAATLDGMLQLELDGVFVLTPAPTHGEVVDMALEANVHVFAEKPLAGTLADAQRLTRLAADRGLLLMAAPATVATPRFRWLTSLIDEGRIGSPTLGLGHFANLGPAAWGAYSGDPAVFYGRDVGPLVDQGIYLLHGLTGLLGPAIRLQAVGRIAIPLRFATGGLRARERIVVEACDHVLLHLEFASGAVGSLVSSFAVSATKAPLLEIHATRGSISISDAPPLSSAGTVDVHVASSDGAARGWRTIGPPLGHRGPDDLIGVGPSHFVACLRREESPLLTPDHACHVMEIIEKALRSIADRRPLNLQTRFVRSVSPISSTQVTSHRPIGR